MFINFYKIFINFLFIRTYLAHNFQKVLILDLQQNKILWALQLEMHAGTVESKLLYGYCPFHITYALLCKCAGHSYH